MYCLTIFRGDGFSTQITFANEKLVLMGLQTDSTKRGQSEVYTFPNNQNKMPLNDRELQEKKMFM